MDAMVTARMPQGKKELGNRILNDLGVNASQAINEFYDYVISNKKLPYQHPKDTAFTEQNVKEALSFLDSIYIESAENLTNLTEDELKQSRLVERGLAQKSDFS